MCLAFHLTCSLFLLVYRTCHQREQWELENFWIFSKWTLGSDFIFPGGWISLEEKSVWSSRSTIAMFKVVPQIFKSLLYKWSNKRFNYTHKYLSLSLTCLISFKALALKHRVRLVFIRFHKTIQYWFDVQVIFSNYPNKYYNIINNSLYR